MEFIKVDKIKCIKCGLCIMDCPANTLTMKEDGPIQATESCIKCGHCVAVCPKEAIDNLYTPLKNQTDIDKDKEITKEEAVQFLKERRSIRNFEKKEVSKEVIKELLETSCFVETGSNTQGIGFKVINNELVMKEIVEELNAWAKEAGRSSSPYAPKMEEMSDTYYRTGKDEILKGAPCLVISLVKNEIAEQRLENGRFALIYAELLAPKLGLGTCWAGFFERIASMDEKLTKLLDIPKGYTISAALMVGYPKFTHKRIVERNSPEIFFI